MLPPDPEDRGLSLVAPLDQRSSADRHRYELLWDEQDPEPLPLGEIMAGVWSLVTYPPFTAGLATGILLGSLLTIAVAGA